MKKNIFKIFAAILVCGLTVTLFTQCHREEEETPVTDDVRVTQIYAESLIPNSSDIMFTIIKDFVWENGLLKSDHSTTDMPSFGVIKTTETHYYYSGNNCIEIHTISDHDIHRYFTYNGERMTKAVEIQDGDTIQVVNIHSYTDDGHVKSMTLQITESGTISDIEFTWENGDLKMYNVHHVVPDIEDKTYTLSYDNYPNVYTGVPLADHIFSPVELAYRGSKHNGLTEGNEYTYANGRLVSQISNTSTQYNTFSDGTTGRP